MVAKIFFPPVSGDMILSAEDQMIYRSAGLANRAKQILQKLVDGPQSSRLLRSIPEEARVQEVFIDDTGMAYVDFSPALSTNHPGGMLNEQATIYSIVNSLTYNFPEIRQVKILIGGGENQETLKGHCLLLPLEMDLSITDVKPREEPTARAD
jgi:germination protein M